MKPKAVSWFLSELFSEFYRDAHYETQSSFLVLKWVIFRILSRCSGKTQINFVLYNVILTFVGGGGVPDITFSIFLLCQHLESAGLSEIVLWSFPDSYNTNAVKKYMPIPILTPWHVYKSSHESVFYNDIICKNCHWNVQYMPTPLRVPSSFSGVGGLHEVEQRWPNSRF